MSPSPSSKTRPARRFPVRTVGALLIMVFGAVCLLYPVVAQWRSAIRERSMANDYVTRSARLRESQRRRLLSSAEAYNRRVRAGLTPQANISDESFLQDPDYLGQLSVDGVMATVMIPRISVQLPIYHGTGEASLNVGAGHLYGTSLPIGGKGTNSVIAGHRGLPGALIFTRLNELGKGDTFYIEVLGERHWYRVDATWVVDPTDISHFGIDGDSDYVTLLTCTPYGVNTQRLLVRGTRIAAPRTPQTDDGFYPAGTYALVVALVVAAFACAAMALSRKARRGQVVRHAAR